MRLVSCLASAQHLLFAIFLAQEHAVRGKPVSVWPPLPAPMESDEAGPTDAASWDAESSVGGSEAATVTEEYLTQLTFLSVRTCSSCGHKSNEFNPLQKGAFKATTKVPCWPWLHGNHIQPKGHTCRICEWTFGLAGFNMTYSSVGAMQKSQNKSATETDEFLACVGKTIELVNNGKFKIRARGRKRLGIGQIMSDLRTKTVDLLKSHGTRVKEPFRAVELTHWEEKNPGMNAVDAGHLVKTLELPGKGLTKCVLLRTLPDGEYNVEVETHLAAQVKERFCVSDHAVRQDQEQSTFQYLGKATASAAHHEGKYKSIESWEHQQKPARLADAGHGDGPECAEDPEAASCSSDEEPEAECADPLMGSLLGDILGCAPVAGPTSANSKSKATAVAAAKTAGSKATIRSAGSFKSPAKPAGRPAASSASSDAVEVPGQWFDSQSPGKARGKGKASKVPQDTAELLRHAGFDVLVASFDMLVDLTKQPAFESLYSEPEEIKDFDTACKSLDSKADKLHKDSVVLHNKLLRRQTTPPDASSRAGDFRQHVKSFAALVNEMMKRDPDPERCSSCCQDLSGASPPIYICKSFKIRMYKQQAFSHFRFGQQSQLKTLLQDGVSSLPADVLQGINFSIIEVGLARMVQSLAGKAGGRDEQVIDLMAAMCQALASDTIVETKAVAELLKLHSALTIGEDPTQAQLDSQQACLKEVVAARTAAGYRGIIKQAVSLRQFRLVEQVVEARLEEAEGSFGRMKAVHDAVNIFNTLKTPHMAWVKRDAQSLVSAFQTACTCAKDAGADSTEVRTLKKFLAEIIKFLGETRDRVAILVSLSCTRLTECKVPDWGPHTELKALCTRVRLCSFSDILVPVMQHHILGDCMSAEFVKNAIEDINFCETMGEGLETVVANSASQEGLEKVVQAYASIEQALSRMAPLPHTDAISDAFVKFKSGYAVHGLAKARFDSVYDKLLEVVATICAGAVKGTEVTDDVKKSVGEALAYAHTIKLLAPWLNTVDASRADAFGTAAEALITISQSRHIYAVMSDKSSEAQLPPEWGLVELQTAFYALDDGKCEAVFTAWDGGEATSVEAWCREFMNIYKEHISAIVKSMTSALTEVVGILEGELVAFGKGSSQKAADKIKNLKEKVLAAKQAYLAAVKQVGLEDNIIIEDSERACGKAEGLTVYWGLDILLKRQDLSDPVDGKKDRQKIKSIYDVYLKDPKSVIMEGGYVPDDVLKSVKGVLELDASLSQAAEPELQPGPAKKARKS